MRDETVGTRVEHRVGLAQTLRDVVGVDDGHLRRLRQPLAAHETHVRPRDRQDARRAERRRRDRADARGGTGLREQRVVRQVRREVLTHRDRADAGATAAVRDAERLVQVEVRHVAAELARLSEPHHRVEVGAVDVHLATGLVDEAADLGDRVLEHTVCRGVGDHDGREVLAVLLELGLEVVEVDLTRGGRLDDDDLEARHDGRRRVRAVRRGGDEADVAVPLTVRLVVGVDREQAGELTLRAGVRLQRDVVVAGDLAQPALEVGDELADALVLVGGRERVQVSELGPRHRFHLGRGVELHRARTEWDHAAIERVVAVGEATQVAQHRGLAVVAVEHRVREVFLRALDLLRPRRVLRRLTGAEAPCGAERVELVLARRLVDADVDGVVIGLPHVDAVLEGRVDERLGATLGAHREGVEERVVLDLEAGLRQRRREAASGLVDTLGDRLQPLRAVVNGVHRRHDGEQHLGGADVRRRLFAADVLLTRLQREAVRLVAVRVHRDADEATRHVALQPGADGHESGVRATETHRDSEALRAADGDVGSPRTGRGEQRQREQVRRGGDEGAVLVRGVGELLPRDDLTVRRRVLDDDAEHAATTGRLDEGLGRVDTAQVGDDDVEPERRRTGLRHGDALRHDLRVDQEHRILGRLADAAHQRHRLGDGGRLVEQRRTGRREPCEVGDDGLEVEQRLEAALADLRLVRRVSGVPGRVLEDVALDDTRGVRAVVAEADHRGEHRVARRLLPQLREDGGLRRRGIEGEGALLRDRLRHRTRDEIVERARTDRFEHVVEIVVAGADVASDEGGERFAGHGGLP